LANVSIYPDWSIRELSAKSPSIQFRPDAIDQRESQSDPTSYAAKEYDVMTLKKRLAICLQVGGIQDSTTQRIDIYIAVDSFTYTRRHNGARVLPYT
jgi:hypothetical protein